MGKTAEELAVYLNQISQNDTPFELCSTKVQQAYRNKAEWILEFLAQPEAREEDYEIGTPREFAERLAWMTINGKPDLGQWENHIRARDAALSRLAAKGEQAKRDDDMLCKLLAIGQEESNTIEGVRIRDKIRRIFAEDACAHRHVEPADPATSEKPCPACGGSGEIHESHGSPYGSETQNCPLCAERPEEER